MKIIDSNEKIDDKTIVLLGNFDGVHLGHKEIIKKASLNKKKDEKILLYTFKTHPNRNLKLLTSLEEKIEILKDIDVDILYLENFYSVKEMEPEDFVKQILINKLNAVSVYAGFNYTFGKNKSGNIETLKELAKKHNLNFEMTEAVKNNEGEVISSSRTRELIESGNIKKAKEELGHSPIIIGEVIHGKKYGRKLGYPTANLLFDHKIYPPYGVYGVEVKIDEDSNIYDGVMNIGKNPTLKPGEQTVEIHILNFDRDIYGKKIKVKILDRVSSEQHFENVEDLITKIEHDVQEWKKRIKYKDESTN